MMVLVVGQLFAADYNVLVYPSNDEISSYLSTFFPTRPFDQDLQDLRLSRQREQELKTLGEALDKAWDSEDEGKLASARKAYDEALASEAEAGEQEDFEVVLLEASKLSYDVEAMVSGDAELLNYICSVNDADLLVVPVVSDLQGFIHLAIYAYGYGEEGIRLIYESVSKDSNRFTPRAVLKLATLFSDKVPAVLRLDNLVTGAEVMVDGKDVPVLDGHLLSTGGAHSITIYSNGYVSRYLSVNLAENEVSFLDASMVQMHFETLSIASNPSAKVKIDGSVVGETPMVLDLYSVPLTMTLSAEGYCDATLSIHGRSEGIEVQLKPKWMGDKELFKERKGDFYGAFARSLLIFGAKLALRAFDNGSSEVFTALDMTANAAITVSVVDMLGCLIDYYRQSEYIAR